MSTHARSTSILLARTGLLVLALGFTLAGLWSSNDLWGQDPGKPGAVKPKKPRVEEEEDAPKTKPKQKPRVEEEEEPSKVKPKRKVIPVEGDDEPKTKPEPNRPAPAASGDLKQLAQQTQHPGARKLFEELAVPHDQIIFKKLERVTTNQTTRQREEFVEPIPVYLGADPTRFRKRLMVQPLTSDWQRDKPFSPNLDTIQYVRPYERIAEEMVREFLQAGYDRLSPANAKLYLTRFDMLTFAEQALAAVLRWHESARQTGQRDGSEEWAAIEKELSKQLLDEVLLPQMQVLTESKDWDRVLALTRRLASSYTTNADRERIARPIADMLNSALKSDTTSEEGKQQARKRLHELELEFPDNPVFRPLSAGLRANAESLVKKARELDTKDPEQLRRAKVLLQQAEEIWPQLPELRAFRLELNEQHPTLRVGIRGRLPKYLSPALACTDAERRVVEMLFESLVKVSLDESGIFRYRPGLAESMPLVVSLGRQFQLPRNAEWAYSDPKRKAREAPKRIDSGDIRATVNLLKKGVGVGRSCAWGQMLDKVEAKGDPYRVTLRLTQGYLDPRALMTFKILPSDERVDSEQFAQYPVCSGPFVLDPGRHSDERQRECMFFVANPAYGLRRSKRDLPRIQEVRFYTYSNAVDELRQGNLDLLLDLTAEEAAKLVQANDVTVPLPAATAPNRRVYFLAINQRKLPDANLRKALAHAINREGLLDQYFRGPLKGVHKALNGPFPAGSWASNPSAVKRDDGGQGLFDAERAHSLSQLPAVRKIAAEGALKLKYPEGDAVLAEALTKLCEQVKEATGIVLEPTPCDPCRLREDVELTQSYDLAYYHYDFPDETYWLWPLLGPPVREDGDSNFLKFTDDKIQPVLKAAMTYRDFDQVRKYQWTVHESLNREMPFIPLWQLDPLLAYRGLKPVGLDPVLVFTNIEEWSLRTR
jgi:ABC-type oligopeptide transport system substrate-binding subunit